MPCPPGASATHGTSSRRSLPGRRRGGSTHLPFLHLCGDALQARLWFVLRAAAVPAPTPGVSAAPAAPAPAAAPAAAGLLPPLVPPLLLRLVLPPLPLPLVLPLLLVLPLRVRVLHVLRSWRTLLRCCGTGCRSALPALMLLFAVLQRAQARIVRALCQGGWHGNCTRGATRTQLLRLQHGLQRPPHTHVHTPHDTHSPKARRA